MAQKITCPVCFTKMNAVGHDLVCPTCGYKYCEGKKPYSYDDHNHNNYESYSQKTTYRAGYASSQGNAAISSQGNYQGTTPVRSSSQPAHTSAGTSHARTGNSAYPQQRPKKNPLGKFIFFIIFFYIIINVIIAFIGSMGF